MKPFNFVPEWKFLNLEQELGTGASIFDTEMQSLHRMHD